MDMVLYHGGCFDGFCAATGIFSQGVLNQDDEGDLKIAMAADKKSGIVRVDFGKPVAWLGLPRDHALQMSEMLRFKAGQLPVR